MTFFKCSSCGRKITRNYNDLDGDDRPLCSFCKDVERKVYNEKKALMENDHKFTYCLNCGVKVSKKFAKEGYCPDCAKLREKQLEREKDQKL